VVDLIHHRPPAHRTVDLMHRRPRDRRAPDLNDRPRGRTADLIDRRTPGRRAARGTRGARARWVLVPMGNAGRTGDGGPMNSPTGTTARNAGLPPEELALLRVALLEQRAFRREQLAGLQPAAGGPSGTVHDEIQKSLAVAARSVLADIEAALDRMATGYYGECRSCRAPIDRSRLRICPQAVECGECHRLREQGGG
jgi:RNA polymerase-binding transcription factor DksA